MYVDKASQRNFLVAPLVYGQARIPEKGFHDARKMLGGAYRQAVVWGPHQATRYTPQALPRLVFST